MAGKYEKVYLLGTGTFGKAWLAHDEDNGKCVLKEIRLNALSDKEIDQTLIEVTVLAKCRHVNVIKYVQAFVKDRSLNIVMEYADGGDLQKKILSQRGIHFVKEVVLDWFVQITFALKYIHDKNILHRDLKPQNVFLTTQNIVKLGDFGISRILQSSDDHAMTTIGTPYYLSPEICQKKPYNHKSDIWALGCILYELCCLRVPFDGADLTQLVLKIVEGKFDPVPSHYGPLIDDLLGVLLHPNPDERPSAEQILCVPKLQPTIDHIMKGHVERKRVFSDMSPIPGGAPTRKMSRDVRSPRNRIKNSPSEDKENLNRSPISNSASKQGGHIARVKNTGRRLSVPCSMKVAAQIEVNAGPVKILNGKVISPSVNDNGSDSEPEEEIVKPMLPSDRFGNFKENIKFPLTYKLTHPRLMRRHSLFTPAINTLLKKQKEREVKSCKMPKRVEREKVGPPPTANLFRAFVASRSESESARTPNSADTSGFDDDVFMSSRKPSLVGRTGESISSLTYKIGGLKMNESPDVNVKLSDTTVMKLHQVLYESVISSHGNTRRAVMSLTSYMQEELGVKQFQQIYSLVLDSAKSATDFRILREKLGPRIAYLPITIQLIQLENALG